ncbi:MAG TPA: hypothetical protein VGP55_11865 [Chitinophagaceae bacterium]|nr:hypothetical protein [Chitinophagaceae bacterium]
MNTNLFEEKRIYYILSSSAFIIAVASILFLFIFKSENFFG